MNGFENNNEPLSEQEMLELEELLVSGLLPSGAMTLDALDGFLTALAVGPESIDPDEWVPVALGFEQSGMQNDLDEESCQRIVSLLIRYRNSVDRIFRNDPDSFLPLFDLSSYACSEDEEDAVRAWTHAFMSGIEMRYDAWAPLIEMAGMPDEEGDKSAILLGPALLLSGRDDRSAELTSVQRGQLRKMVADSIGDIYRFWLPFRDLLNGGL